MLTPILIYEDPDFLVINKPAGMLVHGSSKSSTSSDNKRLPRSARNDEYITVVDWLLKNYPEVKNVGDPSISSGQVIQRPGIVHRLDKDTSGVLLVCRNQKAFEYFKKQFQEHQIKKTYLAVVWGAPKEKEGIIDKPIGLKTGTTKRTVFTRKAKMVKEAITKYKVLKVYSKSSTSSDNKKIVPERSRGITLALLQVQPLTGRTHQIRVHLAAIGHPVVGDVLYGSKKDKGRLLLHAESLEFTPPTGGTTGKRLKISAEAPEEFARLLQLRSLSRT